MKQICFIILFCSFSIGANFAQKKSISDVHHINAWSPYALRTLNMNVVDSGSIKIFYALNATVIGKPETYDDLQCLEIGSHMSKYFSSNVYNSDSLVADWVKKNPTVEELKIPKWLGSKGKFDGWSEYIYSQYFKDFFKNELTEYSRLPLNMDKYNAQYSEPLPVHNWDISDDTLTVVGYLCQKATCRFRGRDYTAWFTIDIPISNGPWKFGGLPGLILKVYDKDKLYTFECVGIKNHIHKFPIKINKEFTQYKKTDRQELWKLKKKLQENYFQITTVTTGITLSYGSNSKEKIPNFAPYNPLELE